MDFPRTHDLDFLLELVRDGGLEPPQSFEAAAWLSPWAAELRYDEPSRSLDREGALAAAERAVQWADETLRRAETS